METYYTKREITQLSSPAQSPRYEVTIPAGTECELVKRLPRRADYVVKDVAKVRGSNPHDLRHYFVWIDASEIEIRDAEWKDWPPSPAKLPEVSMASQHCSW